MQSSSAPSKLTLAFAASGAKNTIPVASQIGITPGAASYTDGFPPLTRTLLSAGGVPPSGQDTNGILYALSSVLRWVNAGGTFPYDSTFANDSNVGGYPKGARVARSDGTGYWFNTTDNNTTDPESAGAAAAGWVPDFTNGVATVAMASANVTLTPLQYGKPIIVITGALTANLNLIFPAIADSWIVVNSTTGNYQITCKTPSGTGIVVSKTTQIYGDGTNIYNAIIDSYSIYYDVIALTTSTVLSKTHVNCLVQDSSSSGSSTFTLPPISSIKKGEGISFLSTSANGCSLVSTSGDVILVSGQTGGVTVTSVFLSVGDTLTVINNGGAWAVTNGTAQLKYTGQFKSSLSTNPGYEYSPTGRIRQFGTSVLTSGTPLTITLPLTFPNNASGCSIAISGDVTGDTTSTIRKTSYIFPSNGSLKLYYQSNVGGTITVCWEAWGN